MDMEHCMAIGAEVLQYSEMFTRQKSMMCAIGLIAKRNYSKNILLKAPSAELRPNQKDSDSLPEYSILDKILFQYIEKRQGPRELIQMGFEEALVDRILKLVNTSEWKRASDGAGVKGSFESFWFGEKNADCGEVFGINSILHFQFSKSITEKYHPPSLLRESNCNEPDQLFPLQQESHHQCRSCRKIRGCFLQD